MRRARPLTGASPSARLCSLPASTDNPRARGSLTRGHSRLRRDFAFWDRRHGPVPPAVGRATYGERRDVHCSGKEESRVDAPGRQFRPLGARGCLASDPRTTRECFPCHEAWASRSDCDLPSMEVDRNPCIERESLCADFQADAMPELVSARSDCVVGNTPASMPSRRCPPPPFGKGFG